MGREEDDVKVDNVVCRTPARNAQNLDAVKNEILEMVDRAVSFHSHDRCRRCSFVLWRGC